MIIAIVTTDLLAGQFHNSSERRRMSSDDYERGLQGKDLFLGGAMSDKATVADWERGRADSLRNKDLAERLSRASADANTSSAGYSGSSSSSATDRPKSIYRELFLGVAYLAAVWGAWTLAGKVATFSLVWWLCALVIVAGLPVYIALAYVWFYLAVAFVVLSVLFWIVKYLIGHPY